MTDCFNCPGCGFELPGTPELTEDCFFCGRTFPGRSDSTETQAKTAQKTAVISVTGSGSNSEGGYEKARMIIQDWHTGESFRKMAKRLGVKKSRVSSVAAALCNVANGNESQPAVLVLLGLEPETAPAPICTNPDCDGYGQPHVFNCQTQTVIPRPAEKQPSNKKRAPRPGVNLTIRVKTADKRQAFHALAADLGMNTQDMVDDLIDGRLVIKEK